MKYSSVREGNAIARYSADGRLDTGTPNTATQAANKEYVDNKIGDIETVLDSVLAIQNAVIGGNV